MMFPIRLELRMETILFWMEPNSLDSELVFFEQLLVPHILTVITATKIISAVVQFVSVSVVYFVAALSPCNKFVQVD